MFVFRVDDTYEAGNDMLPRNPKKERNVENLNTHVANNKRDSSYISTSKRVRTALKYSGGRTEAKKEFRSRIYLIELEDIPKDVELTDSSPYYDFEDERIKKYFDGLATTTCLNFSSGDKEVTVSGAIPADKVKEIHPIIVDMLVLSSTETMDEKRGGNPLYKRILDKIKSGELSIEKINSFITSLKLNDFEREFLEQYYNQRKMINYILEGGAIPSGPDNLFLRQCIRTKLAYKLSKEIIKEFGFEPELEKFLKQIGWHDFCINENLGMTSSNRNDMYVCAGMATPYKHIPYDVEYYEEDGIVTGYKCFAKEVDFTTQYPSLKKEPVELASLSHVPTSKGSKYSIDTERASKERARDISKYFESIKASKECGFNMFGSGMLAQISGEEFGFDDEGVCCELTYSDRRLASATPCIGEDGKTLKGFSPLGYDKRKLDICGCNLFGFPSRQDVRMLKEKEREDIKLDLRDRMEQYIKAKKEKKINVPDKSPIERAIETFAKPFINNAGSLSEEEVYNRVAEKCVSMFKSQSDAKFVRDYISCAIELSKEYNINIEEIVSSLVRDRKRKALYEILPKSKQLLLEQEELIDELFEKSKQKPPKKQEKEKALNQAVEAEKRGKKISENELDI